jgi:N-acetylneuraminic acid mutarotase
LANGQVLVAGGSSSGPEGYLASADLFDPATNRWTAVANLNHARGGHTATLLPDGQILVVGGKDNTQVLVSAERYDPANNRWTDVASPTFARWLHTAALLSGGQVLVAAGKGETEAIANMERYDPAANSWTASAP